MIAAFSSVYGALKGFFERGFWFGAFLPVLIFSSAHAVLYMAVGGPISVPGLTIGLHSEPQIKDLASAVTAIVLILIVLAYSLAPLLPFFRGLVDGSLLPSQLHDWFRSVRLARAKKAWDDIAAARDDVAALRACSADAHSGTGRLASAYAAAEPRDRAANTKVVETTKAALDLFNARLFDGGPLAAAARGASEAVIDALGENGTEPGLVPNSEAETARKTAALADDFEEMLTRGVTEAAYRYRALRNRYRLVGALTNPQATPVGDARFVAEQYPESVYGVRFEFLWPRMVAAMRMAKADDPELVGMDNASSKVDFATVSLVLAASIPAVWLPAILATGGHVWLFLWIGFAAPPVLLFIHEVIFESQLALSEVVKVNIDQSRFLVLRTLRQPEPRSRSEERQIWNRIAAAEEDHRRSELLYTAPAKA